MEENNMVTFNLRPKVRVAFYLSRRYNAKMEGVVENDMKNGLIWINTSKGTVCVKKRNIISIYK